jgi:nucleotide-binding universal stress UspA family protein
MMESASVFADANRKMEEHTKEVLRAYVALAQKDYGIECRGHVVCGENAKEMVVQYIVDHAIQDVYVGTRDVGAFKRFFLGSFSTHVSTHAPCNVVIVRHRAEEAKKLKKKRKCDSGAAKFRKKKTRVKTGTNWFFL